jgi:hypothetical protein
MESSESAISLLAICALHEASRRLPDDLKARHPGIAWKQMAAAGNVYRHDYEDVAAALVWENRAARIAAAQGGSRSGNHPLVYTGVANRSIVAGGRVLATEPRSTRRPGMTEQNIRRSQRYAPKTSLCILPP